MSRNLPRGEDVISAKLTADKVREIRARYALWQANKPYKLAEDYGIAESHLRAIVKGKAWRHVT